MGAGAYVAGHAAGHAASCVASYAARSGLVIAVALLGFRAPVPPSGIPMAPSSASVEAAADPVDAADQRAQRRFRWPLAPPPTVSRPFQPPSHPYGPGHRGVDLAGQAGQPVLAAGDGVVIYAGALAGRGVVSVQHADRLRTSYEPVTALVRVGQRVRQGEPLGSLEPAHPRCPETTCLHWGLRRDGQYLDPLLLLRPARVRLLPWSDRAAP